VLVFMSQDAEPVGTEWLGALVSPLRDDERLAGVYGRQLARNGAVPTERFFLDFVYGPEARTQELDDSSELTMHNTMFSNANAAVRRSLWERFRFADDIIMSEDQDWSRRVLLAGWRIAYQPEAAVLHSHVYTIDTAFRRFFDSGVSAERAYLAGSRASTRVLRREAIRYARQEISWLVQEGHARWIQYAVVYELAKFAGLQLGYRHRLLPVSVSRRLSAMPAYWSRDA
jgi:rhamnosyltransferase